MKRIGAIFTVFGAIAVFYSLTIPVYKNAEAYRKTLNEIERSLYEETYVDLKGQPDPATEFNYERASMRHFKLVEEQLSNRYYVFDFGMCLLIIGIMTLAVGFIGWHRLRSPKSRKICVAIAFLAGLLMPVTLGMSLLHDWFRESAPPWADSIGILLFGLVALCPVAVICSLLACVMLDENYTNGMRLVDLRLGFGTALPIFGAAGALLVLSLALYEGCFWVLVPLFLWLYFLLSLAAGHSPPRD